MAAKRLTAMSAQILEFMLRPYATADEEAAIELWRRTWQQAYPKIDFSARVDWWRARWRNELVPTATITVAEAARGGGGLVTVDPHTRSLPHIGITRVGIDCDKTH